MEVPGIRTKKIKNIVGEIVIKQYGDRTVVSKFPDMSNIIPSTSQIEKRTRFADAVCYAQSINNSPVLKADFLKRVGDVRSVYQHALKEFLNREM